jgi:hypothetical protein
MKERSEKRRRRGMQVKTHEQQHASDDVKDKTTKHK